MFTAVVDLLLHSSAAAPHALRDSYGDRACRLRLPLTACRGELNCSAFLGTALRSLSCELQWDCKARQDEHERGVL